MPCELTAAERMGGNETQINTGAAPSVALSLPLTAPSCGYCPAGLAAEALAIRAGYLKSSSVAFRFTGGPVASAAAHRRGPGFNPSAVAGPPERPSPPMWLHAVGISMLLSDLFCRESRSLHIRWHHSKGGLPLSPCHPNQHRGQFTSRHHEEGVRSC
jgi:hypothetical protein